MIQDDPDTEALAEEVIRWTRHLGWRSKAEPYGDS